MLRLALIGCSDDTAPSVRVAPRLRGGRFTAVADRDARIARSTAAALGASVWSDSLDALLSEHPSAFDAVILRVADRFLAPLCQRAAAAGKHILAGGGPLAESPGHVKKELLPACQRAGVRLMVGQTLRFVPSVRAVKEALDAGQLGEPGLVRIHCWEPPAAPQARSASDGATPARSASEGIPSLALRAGVGAVPSLALRACEEQDEDAGHLLYRLTREIDLACWLFGQHPTEVYALGRQPPRPRLEGPDYVQLHLGFPGNGMALIDGARTLPPGDSYFSLSLIGSAGAAYADDHHNTQLLFGRGHPAGLITGQGDGHVLAEMQEFLAAIEQGREPSVSGADGLRAMQVAMAAASSIATGRASRWDGKYYTPDSAATQVDA